jgi:hypothetical protein
MSDPKELDKILPKLGFTAVRLWRSSLKPLRILEAARGQKEPHEVSASIESMFEDSWTPPQIQSADVAEFLMSQEQSGGFKIAVDVVKDLCAKAGLELNLTAGSRFIFKFQETALDMVNVYELTKALDRATLNESVRRRFQSQGITPYVIIRSLKAKSIACSAYNQKGARVELGARVRNPAVGGELSAEVRSDGGVTLNSGSGKELVFGVDFYPLAIEGKAVTLGSQTAPQSIPRISMETGITQGRLEFVGVETEWHLCLGKRIEPSEGYLQI